MTRKSSASGKRSGGAYDGIENLILDRSIFGSVKELEELYSL
jgi:hypothetical protein